ncbi:hypothetical protein ACFLWS_04990 [Chloroflexota bacterium]
MVRSTKILAIIAFIFIILELYVIYITPAASGYEFSIYSAFPKWFWLLVIGSIACGLIIMVSHAFSSNEKVSNLWVLGFLAIIVTNVVLFMLPTFREYALYGRSDVLTHLGVIKGLLSYGSIEGENVYPITHILSADFLQITGLSLRWLNTIIPPFFFITIYIPFIYLLAREVSENRKQVLLITAFGSLMVFQAYILLAPFVLSFSFLPAMLFLCYKSQISFKIEYRGLLILLGLLLVFFHPYGALFSIFILLFLGLSRWIYRGVKKHWVRGLEDTPLIPRNVFMNLSMIICVALFFWMMQFWAFGKYAKLLADSLVEGTPYSEMTRITGWLTEANLSTLQFAELFMKMYGQQALYVGLSVILCLILLLRIRSAPECIKPIHIDFMMIFAMFAVLTLVSFTIVPDILPHNWERTFLYVILAATVLNGLILGTLATKATIMLKKPLLTKLMPFVVAIILIVSSVFCIFNAFPSPIVRSANQQVTQMEITGWTWLITYSDKDIFIDEHFTEQVRFRGLIFGGEVVDTENIRLSAAFVGGKPHFNYNHNPILGQSYEVDRYLFLSKRSKELIFTVYPEYSAQWAYSPEDFIKLEHDPSVDIIYTNGEVDAFYVNSIP